MRAGQIKGLDQVLRELHRGLREIYGPRLVGLYLYGSRARGDAGEDSDIDVALVLDNYGRIGDEITRTLDVVAGVSLEHDCAVQLMPIRADEWQAADEPLVRSIRREGRATAALLSPRGRQAIPGHH